MVVWALPALLACQKSLATRWEQCSWIGPDMGLAMLSVGSCLISCVSPGFPVVQRACPTALHERRVWCD